MFFGGGEYRFALRKTPRFQIEGEGLETIPHSPPTSLEETEARSSKLKHRTGGDGVYTCISRRKPAYGGKCCNLYYRHVYIDIGMTIVSYELLFTFRQGKD